VTPGEGSDAAGILMDADGNYLVGGWVGSRALVAKFFAGGTLDESFGTGGRKTVGLGSDAEFAAIARRADGRIIAVGSRTSGSSVDSLIVRLAPTGQVDTGFNSTGIRIASFGDEDRLTAVKVQTNNAIVVGGTAGSDGIVARITANGAPDPSFSDDGERTNLPLTVEALILQPDGKIVIGGRTPDADFALMRLNSNGSTDAGFGGADGVVNDLGGVDSVTALALDGDGRIVAAGYGNGSESASHTIVRRYNADGSPDSDFQSTNRAFGLDDEPAAVVMRPDGKILVAGNSKVRSDNDVVVLRLKADGARDDSFGIGGISLQDVGSYPVVGDMVVRPDGRAIVAGSVRVAGRPRLALHRLQGDSSTAVRPAQGFVVDGTGGLHGFSAGCSVKPATAGGNAKWPTKDLARGVALLTGGRGLVVDGTGAIFPFRFGDGSVSNLSVTGNQRWTGKDMARGIAVVPEGTGGFVVNKSGTLYGFRIGNGTRPPVPTGVKKWPGLDVARAIALLPNGQGGYTLAADGGMHPFGGAPKVNAGKVSWPGQDRARGIAIAPDGSGGWIIDSLGRTYPFGIGTNPKPVATVGNPIWPGPIARGVASLP
jgi:uncharacterized delta-60 repeat protein